ncbi:hypothetical protein Rrhod_4373 [Rhodococcus rhodnii LMG 5362]|uniref:Uncharacterized protein n=1 Tax=Rhodococcus rhodnii LMG 5362 TaxID=1273125 RepID=R7WGP5_9NOCA|nr:hypothetical protein Rrhod_4373 [Rhodococcus rhodnii LMG 5362]
MGAKQGGPRRNRSRRKVAQVVGSGWCREVSRCSRRRHETSRWAAR